MPKFKMGQETPKPKTPRKPAKKLPKVTPPKVPGRTLEPGITAVAKRTVTVDNGTWEAIKALGGGDFSRGIREAARRICGTRPATTERKKIVTYAAADDLV